MNQKLCKKLRALARTLAQENGYPEREYLTAKRYVTQVPNGYDERGMVTMKDFEYIGTIKNNPKTVRGIYRVLKKNN